MRHLAIALLDDEYGISAAAWKELSILLSAGDDENDDIFVAVKSADGRFYLPEDWNKP